jgi:hypothetical protein
MLLLKELLMLLLKDKSTSASGAILNGAVFCLR